MPNIFLVYNMGNSGGSWFEAVCNSRVGIRCWEEVHKTLGLPDGLTDDELDRHILAFLREQLESSALTVGLIKSFGPRTVAFCLEQDGRIIQMYRNPIKVVEYKWHQRRLKGKVEDFDQHVRMYARRYSQYLERADKFPITQLEELAASFLTKEAKHFKNMIESLTWLEWKQSDIERVRAMPHPKGKKRWSGQWEEDHSHLRIWKAWDSGQQASFKQHFGDILKVAGYDWPD